jgi:hypothetical protein
MQNTNAKYYSKEEVDSIITKALRLNGKDGISHQELIDIGRELNLDQETIERAAQQVREQAGDEYARRESLQQRKSKFKHHLWSYLIINAFLILINVLTGDGDWWFYWPLMGWGLGLVFHFRHAYFSGQE